MARVTDSTSEAKSSLLELNAKSNEPLMSVTTIKCWVIGITETAFMRTWWSPSPYILKAKKLADSGFQFKIIGGKSA